MNVSPSSRGTGGALSRPRAPGALERGRFGRLLERMAEDRPPGPVDAPGVASAALPASGGACPPVPAPREVPASALAASDLRVAMAWMARAASQAALGPGQLALTLRDPRLGTLRLQVTVRGRWTRVLLHGGRPGVRRALRAEQAGLEAELGRRGLSLESFL